jgi:dihydroorotate dehydrogenase (NAD+) catalytic subunit
VPRRAGIRVERTEVAIELAGLRLRNPVMAGPSAFGYGVEHARALDVETLGAVVTRAITLRAVPLVAGPRLLETPAGLLWADGWANVGLDACLRDFVPVWQRWRTPVVASVAGFSVDEYARVAEALSNAPGVAALQLDLRPLRGQHGAEVQAVAAARARADLPLIVDLPGDAVDIAALASTFLQAGADALCLVNALPGMVIDVRARRPRLGDAIGGLSGPAIRPVAVRMLYEVARALPGVPLIGGGGITSADDALQYIMAGARAVQIGSASLIDPRTPAEVVAGLEEFLQREGVADVNELVGAAL